MTSTGELGHLARLVQNRLGSVSALGAGVVVDHTGGSLGERFVVERERLLELVAFLRRDPDADLALLVDIAGFDYGEERAAAGAHAEREHTERFEVCYQLRSPRLGYRAFIDVRLSEDDAIVPSLTPLYRGAETLERELFEMFGIYPDGHPLLSPYLLYPGFVGHPLRKDYRAAKQQPLVPVLEDELDGKHRVVIDGADDERAP